ncbi:hypothetical protein M8C21_023652, partial [Ambrosia artemisiifolia]
STNDYQESESLIANHHSPSDANSSNGDNGNDEVSIRISSGGGQGEEHSEPNSVNRVDNGGGGDREGSDSGDVSGGNGGGSSNNNNNNVDSAYQQRYDLQQISRWIEQILPFSLLLLIVFIRQHLHGIFVTIYIATFMYKSNDILRKQTALKGERKLSVLAGYCVLFMLQVAGVYWWYQNDDICNPLFMMPPKAIPSFWNAVFTIVVNDTMVRQAAMAFKLVLLMYYKNGRGHSFRRQVM